jgi:hypothetical protein
MSTDTEGKKANGDKDHHLQKTSSAFEQMKGDERGMLHHLHAQGKPMNTLADN